VVGYVVMPEHIHLLITEPQGGSPSTVMQVVKQRTAHALLPKRKRKDPQQQELFGEPPRRAFWQARFYDFNVWSSRKRVEKPSLHASQSGETWIGGIARAVAVEQLSILPAGRTWTRAGERRLGKDFARPPCGLGKFRKSQAVGSIVPALRKKARRAGHPLS
jgi:Transposase IS200 like